ncbi:DNA cytosine methyltransferase [Variovorax boronicumulans]|uniref:DNA cytosine methyltransferase n=1 Tax=Variovorax boronicumulans TaxID=436515 RepID=UPI0012E5FE1C|nr:DNA cytosine methyltransferase [Variovorax boronicumulans]GER21305.1 DNA (cytosine-5-)-methyltransferase [Variovorax boronicumulans]
MRAIDLFAGAGGFSTGAHMADVDVVWAANHWQAAVDVHAANHPGTAHACQDLQQADWRDVPAHDLLLASPACQGHSPARGKEKPHHDALRSTAWAVVSACEFHRPQFVLVENVPEFTKWTLFPAWCSAMAALGYSVAPHLVDSADHGVPQHRVRLFLVCARSEHPLHLKLEPRAHIGANSVIRFETGKWSQVNKAGRSTNTLTRVAAGRARFGHRFVMPYYGSGSGLTGRCLTRPLGTVTTVDRWALVDGDRMRMLTADENRAAMGFPENYVLPVRHREAVHMLGNAVCPPVARDMINALKEAA